MTPDALLARYRRAGVLVDTNLLLLYLVGASDPAEIPRFKRTRQFTPADFALLVRFLERFQRILTTPHVLTETGNLAGQLAEYLRREAFERFATLLSLFEERHTPALDLAQDEAFSRFGITDCAVLHEARGRYLVLTDDFRMSQYLQHEGVDVVNFNHLRAYGLLR